jgi:hypothetical protein
MDTTILEPSRQLTITKTADVLIIGGGPAGTAAAIAAARCGAKTVLVEQFGYLGGTATASLMACINGFRNQVDPETTQVVRGIAEEMVLELKRLNGLGKSPYPQKSYPTEPGKLEYSYAIDTEKFKFVIMKLCRDSGVEMMFHTYFCDTILEKNGLRALVIENKSGRQALTGTIVIDASGDGDVAARAHVPFWQTEHEEANRLGDSIMYRIGFGAKRPEGVFACDFGSNAVVWGPAAGNINALNADELSKAEVTTRLKIYEDFSDKQKKSPELADACVLETPPLIGIRQTRFIEGEYKLTAEDAIQGRRFDDVIAISPCPIISYYGYRRYLEHEGYDVPYRCLLPKKIDNLLIAGRCISSEQQPYESHRAMVPMMAIGQAAGTAAALCVKQNVKPHDLDVKILQKELVRQNAVVHMHK